MNHDVDHARLDPGLDAPYGPFIVLAKSPVTVDPSECPLSYPSPQQGLERLLWMFDDFKDPRER